MAVASTIGFQIEEIVDPKTKNTDDRYRRKTKEKTMLRVLGSRTFSHGLAPRP